MANPYDAFLMGDKSPAPVLPAPSGGNPYDAFVTPGATPEGQGAPPPVSFTAPIIPRPLGPLPIDPETGHVDWNKINFSRLPPPAAPPLAQPKTYEQGKYSSFNMGAEDPYYGAAQLILKGANAIAPHGSALEAYAKPAMDVVDKNVAEREAGYRALHPDQNTVDWGRVGGGIIGSLPTMAIPLPGAGAATLGGRIAAGAGAGAAMAPLMRPSEAEGSDFWLQKAKEAGLGAATGAAVPLVTSALARMVSPNTSPAVSQMLSEGITPTPGEILGPTAKRMEEGLTSAPVVGDVIKSAQRRAVEDFNRSAINQALEPIGEQLGEKTPMGREAISEAADKISGAYNKLLPQLSVKADPQFATELGQLKTNAAWLPPERQNQLGQILKNQILDKFSPNGTMTGETFKDVEETLGKMASGYRNSSVNDERQFGGAVLQLQSMLRSMLERSNPDDAASLQAINKSYANLLRVQTAAGRIGSEEGVFSPAQLLSAVRELDPTLRKSAFARGNALMQDFAEAGKTALGSKVPDSGTPFRYLMTHPISGAVSTAASFPLLPWYTPMGQNLAATLLARRPESAELLAQGLRGLPVTPAVAGATGLLGGP